MGCIGTWFIKLRRANVESRVDEVEWKCEPVSNESKSLWGKRHKICGDPASFGSCPFISLEQTHPTLVSMRFVGKQQTPWAQFH